MCPRPVKFKSPTFIVVRTIEIASLASPSKMFMMWYKIFLILLGYIKKCVFTRELTVVVIIMFCGAPFLSPIMTSEFIAVNILLALLCIS